MRKFFPLRYSITAVLLLTMLASQIVSYIYSHNALEQQIYNHTQQELFEFGRLKSYLEHSLLYESEESIRREVAEIGSDIDVEYLYLSDEEGIVFASTKLSQIGNKVEQPTVFQGKKDNNGTMFEIDGESLYLAYAVVLPGNDDTLRSDNVGVMYVHESLSRKISELERYINIQLVTNSIFIIVLMVVIWLYFYYFVNRRLAVLQGSAKKIGLGILAARTDIGEGDELGELGISFNAMASQLESQHGHLAALQHAMDEHAIVSIADLDGRITYVNERFCEASGFTAEELIGQTHKVVNSGVHDEAFYKEMWRDISKGRVWQGVFQNKRKDGEMYWVQSTIVPILNEYGRSTKYISIRTDVSQRENMRLAMEQLATASDGYLNSIVHSVCIALRCRWAGFGVLVNNGEQIELLAFWQDGVVAKPFTYDLAGTPCENVCTFENPVWIGDEVTDQYPQDQILIDINASSYRGEPLIDEGRVIGVLFAVDDKPCVNDEAERAFLRLAAKRSVLEIRRAEFERQLSDGQDQLADAQRMAHLGSWVMTDGGEALQWSDEMYRIFEIEKENTDVSYDLFINSIHPNDKERVGLTFKESMELGTFYVHEYRLLMNDGRVKWVVERGETKYSKEGDTTHTVGYIHDITNSKKMEREQELLAKGMVVASESRSFYEALRKILEQVCEYTEWPVGHAYVLDDEEQKMVSLGIWAVDDEGKHQEFINVTEKERFSKGKGLPGRVWENATPMWVENIWEDGLFHRTDRSEGFGLVGAFAFPILIFGEVASVLEFFDYGKLKYDPELVKSMSLYVGQIGRIFERHEQEQQLVESEQRYDYALKAANDGLWDWDVVSDAVFYSSRWKEMLGYEDDELNNHISTWASLVDADGREKTLELVQECRDGKRDSFEIEFRMRNKQGGWTDILSRAMTVRSDSGDVVKIVGTHADITSRKQAEKSLKESEVKLREERDFVDAVLTEAGSVIVVLDRNGRIVRFNRYAEKVTGYQYEELSDAPIWESLIPVDTKEIVRGAFENLVEGDVAGEYESEWVMKDGSKRLFDWRSTALFDGKGEIEYVVSQGIDVTVQRQSELKLLRDREQQIVLKGLLESVTLNDLGIEQTLKNCLARVFESNVFLDQSSGGIFIHDEISNDLKLFVSHGLPRDICKQCRIVGLGECQCGEAAEQSKILFSTCDVKDERVNGSGEETIGRYSLPLQSSSGMLGVLAVYLPQGVEINDEVKQFLSSIADILAGYISRKHQEKAVAENESMYRSVAESSSDGFWLTDTLGNILEVNQSYVDMSGYSSSELCSMSIQEIDAEESPKETRKHIEHIIKEGHGLFESTHLKKNGEYIPVELNVSYWPVLGGRFFVFIRDITLRKDNEHHLIQYREHLEELVTNQTQEIRTVNNNLESIIENLPAVFYIKSASGDYQMINRKFEDATGFGKGSVIGRSGKDIFHGADLSALMVGDGDIFLKQEAISKEEKLIHPDGMAHDYLTTKLPLFDDQGRESTLIGIMVDITQQKILQRELSVTMSSLERRASLEHLVSEVTSQLIGVDPELLGAEVGHALARIGGFTIADRCCLMQLNSDRRHLSTTYQWVRPSVSLSPEQQEIPGDVQGYILDILEQGTAINITDVSKLSKKEKALHSWMKALDKKAMMVIPVIYSDNLQGALVIEAMHNEPGWSDDDIELLKTQGVLLGQVLHSVDTQIALRSSKDEAEKLAKTKSEFLANMSHEIRTPLNAVLALAQIGERDESTVKAKNNFKHILRSGRHLLGLVNDVLDFTKHEAGKLVVEDVFYNIGSVIDQSVSFIANKAYEKGLSFTVHESPSLPHSVKGDSLRVTQVLSNILTNSLKFTDKGGISLEVLWQHGEVHFVVTDTGIGMSEEQMSRLFKPFEQADSSTTRKYGGSGLGLAICSYLVDAMDGRILLTSQLGEGTRFEVRLPVTTDDKDNSGVQEKFEVAGLPEFLFQDLTKQLGDEGKELGNGDPAEQLNAMNKGYVLVYASSIYDNALATAAKEAVARGVHLTVLTMPGVEMGPLESLSDVVSHIEWPVRLRNIRRSFINSQDDGRQKQVARLAGLKILAAEDTEVNRMVLADILEYEDATVMFAEDGKIAVDMVNQEDSSFDIVLMDIQMPVMDGYEATRKIKQIQSDLPVIGLTAHAFVEEREKCLAAGMDGHVSKPIDIEILISNILGVVKKTPEEKEVNILTIEQSTIDSDKTYQESDAAENEGMIDWSELYERFSHRQEFITKLINQALLGIRSSQINLRQACENNDLEKIAFESHKIKGIAGSIIAKKISQVAANMEMQVKNLNEESYQCDYEIDGLLNELIEEIEIAIS